MKPEALALFAAGAWTIQALAFKQATRALPALEAVTIAVLVEAMLGSALILFIRSKAELTAAGVWAAAWTGVAGITGFLLIGAALRGAGNTGVTFAVANVYPAIVVVLGLLMFGERISLPQVVGVLFLITGTWLVLR